MKDNKIVQKKRITLVGRDDFTKQDVNTALTSVQTYCDELVRNINELKNGEENPPARTVIAKGPQEQLAVNIDGNAKTADHAKEADKAKMAEDSEKLGGIEAKEYLTKDDLEDITNTTVENSRKLGGLAADKYLLKPEAKEIYASKEELTRNIPEPPKEGEKPKEGPLVVTQAKTLVDNAELKNINIKGKLTVEGDIYQTGPTYETHAEDFYTKKDIIHTRDGAETALPDNTITGIVADKYDVEGNYGALGFDNNGVARVGDVSVTKTETEETIDISKTQAIATREDEPLENGIAQWNADLKRFDTVDPSTLKSDNAKTADNLNALAKIPEVGTDPTSVVNAEWVNTKISTVFVYKGDKTNKTDLPAAADNAIGDVWYVTSEKALYVWNGEDWDELNLNINVENYYTKTEADAEFIDGEELNTALNSYYTKTEADTEFINSEELTTALLPYAKSDDLPDVSGFALTTDITNGTIKPSKVADGSTMVKTDGTEEVLATEKFVTDKKYIAKSDPSSDYNLYIEDNNVAADVSYFIKNELAGKGFKTGSRKINEGGMYNGYSNFIWIPWKNGDATNNKDGTLVLFRAKYADDKHKSPMNVYYYVNGSVWGPNKFDTSNMNDSLYLSKTDADGKFIAKDNEGNLNVNSAVVKRPIHLTTEDLNDLSGELYWGKRFFAVGPNEVLNKPEGVDAFSLEVHRSANSMTFQILYSSDESCGIYYRSDWGFSEASTWNKVASIDDLPDVSGFALTTDITNGNIKPSKVADNAVMIKADGSEQTLATEQFVTDQKYIPQSEEKNLNVAGASKYNVTRLPDGTNIDTLYGPEYWNMEYSLDIEEANGTKPDTTIYYKSAVLKIMSASISPKNPQYNYTNQTLILFSNREDGEKITYFTRMIYPNNTPSAWTQLASIKDIPSLTGYAKEVDITNGTIKPSKVADGTVMTKADGTEEALATEKFVTDKNYIPKSEEGKLNVNSAVSPNPSLDYVGEGKDLNDITKNGWYYINGGVSNGPTARIVGFIEVLNVNDAAILQTITILYSSTLKRKARFYRSAENGDFTDSTWIELANADDLPSLTGYATEDWVTNKNYLDAASLAKVPHKQTLSVKTTEYADDYARTLMSKAVNTGWAQTDINETFDDTLAPGDYVTLKLTSSTGRVYIGLQQVEKINKDGVAIIYLTARSYYIENYLPADSKVGDKKIASEEWVNNNYDTHIDKSLNKPGWYRVAELYSASSCLIQIGNSYNYHADCTATFSISVGYAFASDKNYLNGSSINQLSSNHLFNDLFPKIRIARYLQKDGKTKKAFIEIYYNLENPNGVYLNFLCSNKLTKAVPFTQASKEETFDVSYEVTTLSKNMSLDGEALATEKFVTDKGYATETWVGEQGFAKGTIPSLDGYATEAWVGKQGFAKSTEIPTDYVRTSDDQSISGVKSFSGGIKVLGTAAGHHFTTRGIVGSDSSGSEISSLYLQYENNIDDTVYFGKSGGGSISNNGTFYSGTANKASIINEEKTGDDWNIDNMWGPNWWGKEYSLNMSTVKGTKPEIEGYARSTSLKIMSASINPADPQYDYTNQILILYGTFKNNEESKMFIRLGINGGAWNNWVEIATKGSVEQAITSKNYQNEEQVQKKVDDKFRLSGTTLYIE